MQNDVQFIWGDHAQKEALKKLKEAVTVTSVLCYYNLTEEVTLQGDASQTSLADAFLQKGQPVAYASHALTPAGNKIRSYCERGFSNCVCL